MNFIYNKYSDYLKNKYMEKVYKLPISLRVTCPNRDGNVAFGGCTYCGETGTGFENNSSKMSVKDQLYKNMHYIKTKYKAEKFIAYFQSFSNTYLPLEDFKRYIKEAILENIVEIAISTRPDCINEDYLEFLQNISKKYNLPITIELGLQTSNYKTLNLINRGHTLAEYIESAVKIKAYNFNLCTHVILNLPWDDIQDSIETAKIISVLKSDYVKLHALYIEKNTVMAEQYLAKEFEICSMEDYIERTISFLEYLSPNVSIQRILSRAPEDITLFSNWGTSWWKIKDQIENTMILNNRYQGRLFNYSNGSALKKFI